MSADDRGEVTTDALRSLPQVDDLVRSLGAEERVGPIVARWLARSRIAAARERIFAGEPAGDVRAEVEDGIRTLTERGSRRIINATGVVLHTNMGRAQLADEAIAAVTAAARATPVELDLRTGERGSRAPVASTLAAALCDAENALVVNNNAAALVLVLAALAHGREVVVSRGELVEIGGEFRLPDVMEVSGAILREVGTTNRTRAKDYRRAVGERTGLILKVHPSNFRIEGFTAEASVAELAEIARDAGVPFAYDIGSGMLRPRDGVFEHEPDAATALASGADLVCFSGDKLLGGAQAGIIAGRADLVERCRRHPFARAVRADKLTLAATEATLWLHARGSLDRIPTWSMLEADDATLRARAESVAREVPGASVVDGHSVTGGGSTPGATIPSPLVSLAVARPERALAALRAHDPPTIARIERGAVIVDLRTVLPNDDVVVSAALRTIGG